ncbi:Vitamin B12 transporter BtuB [Alteripontixanthobacter maritimus]|uniref:Vitamin B12 transporter BtuB n=1 Tax=Alteripontixanthobacter maritimus TaxID=2161824 RepID=A0A369Q314_9SPHN|nr:TonB-dependent receptor [Alteripontixanthobacter maritimus]RDC59281.1 Vitamin B12 transporter BtuB [Alteripontixanthobacter maritimus]
MRKIFNQKGRFSASAGIVALSLAALATPAYAQDVDPDEDEDEDQQVGVDESDPTTVTPGGETEPSGLIVVSGSRIQRPNLDSPVPVTSVAAEELLDDGALSLGDALNDLPSLRSTFSTSNSQRFIGTTGVNFLDLRGLGTSRTLVLVNNRRHVTGSAGDFRVDINTIPFELLERTDVVTGGSSAVYGSDAIAGVVNFITKRDFEGLEISAQSGISERGDNGRYTAAIAAGKNFADGRGNIAAVAEYSKINRVLNVQRPEISGAFIGFEGFVQIDDLSDEGITNSDGIPDFELRDGLRLDFISDGGTLRPFCIFGAAVQPLACDADGNDVQFRFTPTGDLVREDNLNFPGTNNVQGGTGSDFGTIGTLIPDIERYNINLLGRFDISDAVRPYVEAKYARIEARGAGTPSFLNGICGNLGGAVGLFGRNECFDEPATPTFISFDNPFLTPAARATAEAIQDELLVGFGFPPNSGAATGFAINRNNIDFGARTDVLKRETYRIVVGVEGDISSNTRYDISFNYGRFTSSLAATNNLVFANLQNAVDAVRDPATGNIVCRINADADATNDDPACAPLNLFGVGAPSAAALDYINTDATLDDKAQQYNLLGFVNTDSSGFFELPGGPIRAVLGGEYRKETASSRPDDLSATGNTFFNAFGTFSPPDLEIVEAFGEIEFPLLANLPFADELTVSAAGRVSDYNSGGGQTGTVYSYNGNLVYSPIPDLRFRANYSRAVRSPTLSDLFAPLTQNFGFLNDPCDDETINLGPASRLINCRADGVPEGYDADGITSNTGFRQRGDEALKAEISDSYTVGAIFEPSFLPGFAASVDYYDITVENVISQLPANAVLALCYDATSLQNRFCDQVNPREPEGDLNQDNALTTFPINFARLEAEGIDFDVRYSKTFDNDDRISFRALATHVLKRTNFLDSTNPNVPNVVRGELGDPEWAVNFNASYRTGPFTLSYGLRFLDKQFINGFETTNSFTAACVEGRGTPGVGVIPRTEGSPTCTPGELIVVPAINPDATAEEFYEERFYHSLRGNVRVSDDFSFYAGVDNLTDQAPPLQLTGSGGGSSIYDNIGRYFYAGFTANF